jgi:hypothetical protein
MYWVRPLCISLLICAGAARAATPEVVLGMGPGPAGSSAAFAGRFGLSFKDFITPDLRGMVMFAEGVNAWAADAGLSVHTPGSLQLTVSAAAGVGGISQPDPFRSQDTGLGMHLSAGAGLRYLAAPGQWLGLEWNVARWQGQQALRQGGGVYHPPLNAPMLLIAAGWAIH